MTKLKAYSKVNLILKVFPQQKHATKHKIHSLFCLNKSLYDDVYIEENNKTNITFKRNNKKIKISKCQIPIAIEYLTKLLKRKINLNIVIHKRIPIMSGLGGSATDVAAIISWIVKKYHFKLTSLHLKYIALNIGSDIPFFLAGYDSAWVSEYGNKIIENKKLIPKFKVIFSNIPINTTQVYRSMKNRYISKVNIKKAYEDLNKKKNCHDVIYNDMWTFANKLSKQLRLFSDKLSKTKKIILTGSGGSFVEII